VILDRVGRRVDELGHHRRTPTPRCVTAPARAAAIAAGDARFVRASGNQQSFERSGVRVIGVIAITSGRAHPAFESPSSPSSCTSW
jgi:hypothetical protein